MLAFDGIWWDLPNNLVMTNIATENDHRTSGFSNSTWWFSIAMLNYQRVPQFEETSTFWNKPHVYKAGPIYVQLYHPLPRKGAFRCWEWRLPDVIKTPCLVMLSCLCDTAIINDHSIHPKHQNKISPQWTIILGSKFVTQPHILVLND